MELLSHETLCETPGLESSFYFSNLCASLGNKCYMNSYIHIFIIKHIHSGQSYSVNQCSAVILDHTTSLGMNLPTLPLIGYILHIMSCACLSPKIKRRRDVSLCSQNTAKKRCCSGEPHEEKMMCFLFNLFFLLKYVNLFKHEADN